MYLIKFKDEYGNESYIDRDSILAIRCIGKASPSSADRTHIVLPGISICVVGLPKDILKIIEDSK